MDDGVAPGAQAAALHQLRPGAQALDKARHLREVVARIRVAHHDEAALRGGDARAVRAMTVVVGSVAASAGKGIVANNAGNVPIQLVGKVGMLVIHTGVHDSDDHL